MTIAHKITNFVLPCEARLRPVRAFYPVVSHCDRRGLYRVGGRAYCMKHAERELGRKLTDEEKGR